MKTYKFIAYAEKNRLGEIDIKDNSLPSHVSICLAIKREYPEATRYTMLGSGDKELIFTPVNLEKYVSHEFLGLLKDADYRLIRKHVQYIKGPHDGQKGTILGFHVNDKIFGTHMIVCMEDGSYENVCYTDIKNIKLVG